MKTLFCLFNYSSLRNGLSTFRTSIYSRHRQSNRIYVLLCHSSSNQNSQGCQTSEWTFCMNSIFNEFKDQTFGSTIFQPVNLLDLIIHLWQSTEERRFRIECLRIERKIYRTTESLNFKFVENWIHARSSLVCLASLEVLVQVSVLF